MNARKSIAADVLYPKDQVQLKKALDDCFTHGEGPGKLATENSGTVAAVIVPHDSLERSGPIATHAYGRISGMEFDTVVLIGPDQNKTGDKFSIYPEGKWETPLGEIEVDSDLCKQIASNFPDAKLDSTPHEKETSIEVQLPFLQTVLKNKFRIVPILVSVHDSAPNVALGKVLANIAKERKILIVGISNLTSDLVYAQSLQRDALIYDRIIKPSATDIAKLHTLITERKILISGFGPIAVAFTAAQQIGAKKSEATKHSTSGNTTGDYSTVSGYCAVAFTK